MAILFMLLATYFNSRPCVRGDGKKMTAKKVYITFQFTPLREGRLTVMEAIFLGRVFQFTPLREGRRDCSTQDQKGNRISIHAPA